jgi:hypothetical protein
MNPMMKQLRLEEVVGWLRSEELDGPAVSALWRAIVEVKER